ncbi:MAG: MMPL family transporter [Candidatus Omnitrophica bacterium]|nr:MMPL family transporter [Candidatus Omnitrophota bacterium]MDD5573602.1 MMPL family transporter [Candidatus Omnitrophota bacterium]
MLDRMVAFALKKPKIVFLIAGILTVAALAQFLRIRIDTDPENMLPENEFVRRFHQEVKKEFALYDYIVVGVVNESHPEGVFNPQTLEHVYDLTREIGRIEGVIAYDMISLSTKDDVQGDEAGSVRFQWLMHAPPYTETEARWIRSRAMDNPMFYNTLVSEDGRALAIYVPIKEKKLSYAIAGKIGGLTQAMAGEEQYYMTGLPLAEDAFGHEMFVQMGVSAPAAMIVIFLLMWFFFKNARLVVLPLLMAADVVILTMGLMVGLGFPIHIMSSMIPIFLLPICVLDSIHLLSDFYEEYRLFPNKEEAIRHVMRKLFLPNLFTSLTTVAGFFSLSFAPIPPVQVFGIFVAIGVALAWLTTVLFIPAYVALMDASRMASFGVDHKEDPTGLEHIILEQVRRLAVERWKLVLAGTVLVVVVSVFGLLRIKVNDNPTKWFSPGHPIRVADAVLNRHFGGTYGAYLVLQSQDETEEVFLDPALLNYVRDLQEDLLRRGSVGKSTSLSDITSKVYDELLGGGKKNRVIPPTKEAVAQCLLLFQNSHKPDDLWHFVTPDYGKANLWLQLKSGDNRDMAKVVKQVEAFLTEHPAPRPLAYHWSGLTYINMVWQDKMVVGMFVNFLGSFLIVLLMMVILFRSPLVGLLSMIPMTVTIIFIYSMLGFLGKEYDMPVAVLSALTLGLSIDYAIHFIERSRQAYKTKLNWPDAAREMFGPPARALVRNALVISIAFSPLFLSSLVPYKTVGFFMLMIMIVSSIGTLLVLPAIISAAPRVVFGHLDPGKKISRCACGQCMLLAAMLAAAVLYVLLGYSVTRWNVATVIAVMVVAVLGGACFIAGRIRNRAV